MESQVAKKANAGALANINLRADSGKGAEEIKSDDVSTPILKRRLFFDGKRSFELSFYLQVD